MIAKFPISFTLVALTLAACGNADTEQARSESSSKQARSASVPDKDRTPGNKDMKAAAEFFKDLPDAREVPAAEMGNLYFKLLTRITVKAQAARNEKAARSTRDLIDYAHAQAMILEARSESLPEEEKSKLFQASLSQIMWAERKYQMALRKFGDDDPKYLRDFAEYADKDWPQLR